MPKANVRSRIEGGKDYHYDVIWDEPYQTKVEVGQPGTPSHSISEDRSVVLRFECGDIHEAILLAKALNENAYAVTLDFSTAQEAPHA